MSSEENGKVDSFHLSHKVDSSSVWPMKCFHVIREILSAEEVYVTYLENIVKGYMEPFSQQPWAKNSVDGDLTVAIFGNVDDLLLFHRSLLKDMRYFSKQPPDFGDMFLKHEKNFDRYKVYCKNYQLAMRTLENCMEKNVEISNFLLKCEQKLNHIMPLRALLVRPVQEIGRYHMLLANVTKVLTPNFQGYTNLCKAHSVMMKVAEDIVETVRLHEMSIKIQEIESCLVGWKGQKLSTYGKVLQEDFLNVIGHKAPRYVIAFQKLLLLLKKAPKEKKYHYKGHVEGNDVSVVANPMRNHPFCFKAFSATNKDHYYLLKTKNDHEKTKWIATLHSLTQSDLTLSNDMLKRMDTSEQKNQKMINFMIEARKNNKTIKVRFGRVLFSGSSAAGKTSFYKLLMKRERSKEHISSRLAEPEQVIAAVKVDVHSKDDYVELYELDIKKEILKLQSLLNTMANYEPNKVEFLSTDTIPDKQFEKDIKVPDIEESKLCTVEVQMAKESASRDTQGSASYDTQSTEMISIIDACDEIMNVFTFMDTGGQPQFISMLPAVNSSAMVTFIIHNVAKSLDDDVTVTHGDSKGNATFLPYTIGCTNSELIKSLIAFSNNSMIRKKPFLEEICEHAPQENISYLSFIGTHIDEVLAHKKIEDTVHKIDDSLGVMIAEAGLQHVWMNVHPNYDYLIPVNNLTSEAENEYKTYNSANEIRQRLYNKIKEQAVYNVPIVWLLLELEIRKQCEERRQKFIPYSEIVDLCKKHNLTEKEDDIKNGLRFHHLFGVLLYFDEVPQLCDYVFTDYKWLFDNLTEIVYQSYYDRDNPHFKKDFKQKGFFTKSLLDKCNLKLKYQSGSSEEIEIYLKEGFIELLKYLRIIAPLTQEDKSELYFMPSLLSTCNFETNQLYPLQEFMPEGTAICDQAEPLLIQFKLDRNVDGCGSFPRGAFSCLVVELLQDTSKWELHWLGNKKRVFENLVTLLYQSHHYVTLIDRIFYLEVVVLQVEGIDFTMDFQQIKVTLDMALNQIGSKLNLEKFVLTYSFICHGCLRNGEHGFLKEASQDILTCDYRHLTRKTDKHTIWDKEICDSEPEDKLPGGKVTMSAREAIKKFNVELIQQLPLENDIFFAMAGQAGLFPLDNGDSIAAEPTRAKKVTYFLRYVVEPGAEQYLHKLLKVMRDSKVANVVRLADDIQAATGIGFTGGKFTMSAGDAIKQFSVNLNCELPLENDIFFAMAAQAGLFPLDTGDSIAAKSTRAQKVTYFLRHIVEPGAEQYLPELLKVMRDSKVANVVRLADDIQAATGIDLETKGRVSWEEEEVS